MAALAACRSRGKPAKGAGISPIITLPKPRQGGFSPELYPEKRPEKAPRSKVIRAPARVMFFAEHQQNISQTGT
jgi:hypothetical protein